MKKILFIALLFCINQAKAQFITIPDAKFAAWLQTNIPSAMSGNQMDTTDATVTTYTMISVESDSIGDLTGIQYFDSLKVLDCSNSAGTPTPNYFTTLPYLPNSLSTLLCGNNSLTSLPALPNSMTDLECYNNSLLHSLPTLPSSLLTLVCYGDSLTSLPGLPSQLNSLLCSGNPLGSLPTLPNSLTTLVCIDNQLTSLPALPNSISFMQCYNNLLTTLPALPTSLGSLYCNDNQLTTLPALPNSLTYLVCTNNLIDSLPALPNALSTLDANNNLLNTLPALPNSLTTLDCSVNPLSGGLPMLPDSLQALYCYYTGLTTLPALPGTLTYLEAEGSHIACFPVFPNSLSYPHSLFLGGNPFTCLPNYVPAMDSLTLIYPLCTAGNSNGCPASCAPVLNIASNKYTICKGDSQLLAVSGANTYTWSPTNTLSDSTSASPYAKPSVTTVYSVVGTGTNTTCGNSAPLTVTVTINTIQTNSAIICVGGAATLTASGVNTYTWSTGDTTASITESPTVTTNYIVTGTDSANCIISDTTAISITTVSLSTPVLSGSTNPITICQGMPITINVTSDSNSVAVWYVNSSMVNLGNTYSPSTSVADTLIYTVIDSSTVIGCSTVISSPLTFSLIVNPAPTLPNITDSSFIHCPGTSFSPINATGSGAIVWYANSTISTPLYVGNAFTPDSLPIGTTYLFVKDSSLTNGCFNAGTDSIHITINSMQVNSAAICAGGTATLTASGVNTYTWSTGDTTASIITSPMMATNYTVTGTDLGNCLFTDVTQITINAPISIAPPTLGFSNLLTICQGAGLYLNVTPDSSSTPIWYLNSNQVNVGNSYFPSTAVADTAIFTIIDSLAITGCPSVVSSPLTFSLIINPAPTAPHIAESSGVYCQGSPLPVLHATGSDSIVWLVNGLPASTGSTYTITSPPLGTTYYFALDSSTTNGCFNVHADSIYITINAAPVNPAPPVLSFQSNPITVCQGVTWLSINVTPDSASTPVWYLNNSMVYVGNSYTPPTLVADTVVYTVIDSIAVAGCTSAVSSPLTFSLIVNPTPTTPIITDSSGVFCQGAPLSTIHATGSGAIEWTINGQPVYVGNTFTPDSLPIGTTYIFALDSSTTNSCFGIGVDSIYITILPDSAPTVNFQLIPDSVPHVYGINAYYSANVVNARWYWGDGTNTLSMNPVHTYDSAGVYNICVTAYNACADSVNYCQTDSVFRTAGNTIISVHVIEVTGISTVTAQTSAIKVYPNPAQSKITVDASDIISVKLFDMLGKQITSVKSTDIDVSTLIDGVYFVQVQTKQKITTQKIIVQH